MPNDKYSVMATNYYHLSLYVYFIEGSNRKRYRLNKWQNENNEKLQPDRGYFPKKTDYMLTRARRITFTKSNERASVDEWELEIRGNWENWIYATLILFIVLFHIRPPFLYFQFHSISKFASFSLVGHRTMINNVCASESEMENITLRV